MGNFEHTQVEYVIDGQTYKVPATFAAIAAYLGYSEYTPAQILGYTVGQFETSLNQIENAVKSLNWASLKATILQYAPDTPAETLQIISYFAAGNFALLDEGFAALRDFLSRYPDSTSLATAFADIDGYTEAVEDALQKFNESLANQTLTGSPGNYDAEFEYGRSQYKVTLDSDGNVVILGPNGGSAKLIDMHKLVFADSAYNLQIASKAASISAQVLDSLVDLYVAYFNRAPEADGLSYWIDQHLAGKSLNQIAVDFYNAGVQFSDVTGYSSGMPLADFIGVLYKNVLGRTGADSPNQSEIDYWLSEVASGQVTREGMVQRFLSDARILADHPEYGFVADLLDNKVALGKLHAITYGIDYLSQEEAISKTVALAAAVNPATINSAIDLIGLGTDNYV